jgi:hypothetical protein
MTQGTRFHWRVLFATLFIGGVVHSAHAQDVVAVLSSDSSPYQEALTGFEETYGQNVPALHLSREDFKAPHPGTIVVAFGGKAALEASSYEGVIIYGLAPGIKIHTEQRSATLIRIHTSPPVRLVLQRYKEVQPSLRRLAVLWIGDSIADYFAEKDQIASALGVELISLHLKTLDDLPGQLRNLQGKADAIWMPPDAALITPQSFAAVREFCNAQHIPFYVPSDGLVEKGATAAVYTSFRELGRLAGAVAKKSAAGTLGETRSVYPDKISLAVNVTAANRSGLTIAPDVLRNADKVVR